MAISSGHGFPQKLPSPGVSPGAAPKLTAYHGKDTLSLNSVNTSLLTKYPEGLVNQKIGKAFRNNSNEGSPANSSGLKKSGPAKENGGYHSHADSVSDAGL